MSRASLSGEVRGGVGVSVRMSGGMRRLSESGGESGVYEWRSECKWWSRWRSVSGKVSEVSRGIRRASERGSVSKRSGG